MERPRCKQVEFSHRQRKLTMLNKQSAFTVDKDFNYFHLSGKNRITHNNVHVFKTSWPIVFKKHAKDKQSAASKIRPLWTPSLLLSILPG